MACGFWAWGLGCAGFVVAVLICWWLTSGCVFDWRFGVGFCNLLSLTLGGLVLGGVGCFGVSCGVVCCCVSLGYFVWFMVCCGYCPFPEFLAWGFVDCVVRLAGVGYGGFELGWFWLLVVVGWWVARLVLAGGVVLGFGWWLFDVSFWCGWCSVPD